MYTSKLNSWNWKDNDSQQESPFFHGTRVHLLNRCITYICRYTFLGRLRKYLQNNIMRPHLMNRGEKFYRGTSCEAANGSKSNCLKKRMMTSLRCIHTSFQQEKTFWRREKIELSKLYPVEDETRRLQKMEIKREQYPVFRLPNHLRSQSCQQGPKDMVDPFVLGMLAF